MISQNRVTKPVQKGGQTMQEQINYQTKQFRRGLSTELEYYQQLFNIAIIHNKNRIAGNNLKTIYNKILRLEAKKGENTMYTLKQTQQIIKENPYTCNLDEQEQTEIEMGIGGESDRKLITSKNRLFGKKNIDGYLIHYDEKSKRIYGDMDDVDKKYSWSDAFEDGKEVPFE